MARWPKYKPTAEQRRQVKVMAGFGIPQADIANLIECDTKTLRKHYRRELDIGATEANTRVVAALFTMATVDKNPAAAIWWTKARMGWRDRSDASLTVGNNELTFMHLVAVRKSGDELNGDRIDGTVVYTNEEDDITPPSTLLTPALE